MKKYALLIPLIHIFTFNAQAMDCPAYSEQTKDQYKIDASGEVSGLWRLSGGQLQAAASKQVVNLFASYPNADKVAIGNTLIALFCRQGLGLNTMPEAEKADRINIYTKTILQNLYSRN